MVNRSVTFKVFGREYLIEYPTVGQYYKIEALKQSLTGGYYNTMVLSPSAATQQALDMVDIEATLTILVPQFIKDLKVKNFNELGILDYKAIHDEFIAVVAPYFKEIEGILNGTAEENGIDE